MILRQLRISLIALVLFTILTGVLYPLAVTAIAQIVYPDKANGSLIVHNGSVAGSELIGQPFADPGHFWGRPSATGPTAYNAGASSGSNLGPLNPSLLDGVASRVRALKEADSTNTSTIPVDLVTASGSGLDPHISVAAAMYQVTRVARVRGLDVETLRSLVRDHMEGRQLGFLGEARVNVLRLNLALDGMTTPVKGE